MTPKRAALIGLMFPVIAVVYWALPTMLGGTVDSAGITMLHRARCGDVAHGVRPRHRHPQRS